MSHDGSHGSDCFGCRIKTVAFGAGTAPSRTVRGGKPSEPKNSWERGIARDHRGMPRLDSNLEPIRVHRWASERSSFIESLRQEANTSKE